jgi:hypothetical protein
MGRSADQLERYRGRAALILEDGGGEPLARLLSTPIEVGTFLRLAIRIARAVGSVRKGIQTFIGRVRELKRSSFLGKSQPSYRRAMDRRRFRVTSLAGRLLRRAPQRRSNQVRSRGSPTRHHEPTGRVGRAGTRSSEAPRNYQGAARSRMDRRAGSGHRAAHCGGPTGALRAYPPRTCRPQLRRDRNRQHTNGGSRAQRHADHSDRRRGPRGPVLSRLVKMDLTQSRLGVGREEAGAEGREDQAFSDPQ